MYAARVIIFGSGPRLRSICARLVLDATVDVDLVLVDSFQAATARCALPGPQTILLDARVAVGPHEFLEILADPADVIVSAAIDWQGQPSELPAAIKKRTPADAAYYVRAFGELPPSRVIGAWLDCRPRLAPQRTDIAPVRVRSYGRGMSGYAAASRNLMIGLQRAGVDVGWSDDFDDNDTFEATAADRAVLTALLDVRRAGETPLIFHPPTFTDGRPFLDPYLHVLDLHAPIAMTMFETSGVPGRWTTSLARCEQVWVPSSFNVESFARSGISRDALRLVPIGVDFENRPIDGPSFNLTHGRSFTFLAVAEWTRRKGFDVLLAAYARAFTASDDVALVIRSHYAKLDIAAEVGRVLAHLGLQPQALAPIFLVPRLPLDDLYALYRAADAYVLPTRGEGFGLPYLEAMAFGVPTIGTDWGGNTDFLNARTGFPISASLKAVDRRDAQQFPIFKHQFWAEPSIDSTARAMRRVFDHREEAALVAARGLAIARTQFNRDATALRAVDALRDYRPRARHARPARSATNAAAVMADCWSATSSGSDARSVVRALDAADVRVVLTTPFAPFMPDVIRADEAAFVAAHSGDGALQPAARIVHAPPGELQRLPIDAATIVMTHADRDVHAPGVSGLLNRARFVCVPSVVCAELFERAGVDAARLRVIPACVDTDFWCTENGGLVDRSANATFNFVSVDEWHAENGWETLATAYALAFTKHDPVTLSWSVRNRGQNDRELGERVVRELGALLSARFPDRARAGDLPSFNVRAGSLAEEDMPLYYGAHDAFVMVPRTRRPHRVFLEAMACGLPTIAPRAGAHLAVATDENSYLVDLVPPATAHALTWEVDAQHLAATLRRVYERAGERDARARAARRAMTAHCSHAAVGPQLRALVDEISLLGSVPDIAPERAARRIALVVVGSRGEQDELACLDRLRRHTAAPIVGVCVWRDAAATAAPSNARVVQTAGDVVAGTAGATHVAFIDAAVLVGPAWDVALIDALRCRPTCAIAVPQANIVPSGDILSARQLGYESADLRAFDRQQIGRAARLLGRGGYVERFAPYCSVVDAVALRAVDTAGIDRYRELLQRMASRHPRVWSATDVFVHVGGGETRCDWLASVLPDACLS